MPGYVAGASLVFVKVFDDLGTPLVLDDQHARAAGLPAHHLGRHRGSDRLRDQRHHGRLLGAGAVASARYRSSGRDYATLQRGGAGCAQAHARAGRSASSPTPGSSWCCCSCSRRISASCCCRSRKVWSFSVAARAFTLAHYATVFRESPAMIGNTLLYCGARGADRRDPRHGDRLPHPAHAAAGAPHARLHGHGRARDSRRRARRSATCARSAASSCRSPASRSRPPGACW